VQFFYGDITVFHYTLECVRERFKILDIKKAAAGTESPGNRRISVTRGHIPYLTKKFI